MSSKEVICADYRQERHNIKVAREEAEVYMNSLAPPGVYTHTQNSKKRKFEDYNNDEDDGEEDDDGEEIEVEVEVEKEVKGTRAYRRAKTNFENLNAMYNEKLFNEPSRTHRALIKLSVWPVIRRYTPGSLAEDTTTQPHKPLHEKDGFRIFMIAKAGVVAYYGREDTAARRRVEGDGYVDGVLDLKRRVRVDAGSLELFLVVSFSI